MPHKPLKRSTPTLTPAENHPNQTLPPTWAGWYFEYDYLCTPAGDRFTAKTILACYFVRQMEAYRQVMYMRPPLDD